MTRAEILKAAQALSPYDRLRVAREIVMSVEKEGAGLSENEWDEAWGEEAERRLREMEEGKVKTVPGEEVMARIRAIVRLRR